ncbi:MAG: gliding motility-associated C-terminal domain-containing protein [Bacteroidota bacterium]
MKFRLSLICFSLFVSLFAFADTPVKIRRICVNGLNNEIYFTPSTDTCSKYFQYKIWGRIGSFGPFTLIDSIPFKNANQFTHVDANSGGTKNWSYFITIIDSCGPDFETRSDTIPVDRIPPGTVILDSVSIDPITNTPHIGWTMNHSPDFSYFKLYSVRGVNTPIFPFSKDTFYIDTRIGSSPATEPLRYDLSCVDSCGLETVFEINQHVSMYLSVNWDTCARQANLSWTPYIGWNAIRKYYIYRQTESGEYEFVDSIDAAQTSYKHLIALGTRYRYFIRAFKDAPGRIISSSSNSVEVMTRLRAEPANSYLSVVSIDQPSEQSTIIHIYNPNEEVTKYTIKSSSSLNGTYENVAIISPTTQTITQYSTTIPFIRSQKYFMATATNVCNEEFPSTNKSRYSELTAIGRDLKNQIYWEPYFTWNTGVDYYNLYRGTSDDNGNINYSFLTTVSGTDSSYIDEALPSEVGETGICYYVEAVQVNGDINGNPEHSFSTHGCAIGQPTVFIPNAFYPYGVNKAFRPEGRFIDYDRSRMEIYDRWGSQLISMDGIRKGWDGKDSNGILNTPGVYYYKIYILSSNVREKEKVFIGFVTLLN